jgi:acyl-CoA thioester hydrolase
MLDSLRSYPYTIGVDVTFRDLDALGHVNNSVYLTYLETARITYLIHLLELKAPAGLPIIMAEANVAYKSPAFFGERLAVGVGVSRFGGKSFDMLYRVEAADGRLVALGKTVQVMYDYEAARTIPVPEELRERVRAFQGEWRAP